MYAAIAASTLEPSLRRPATIPLNAGTLKRGNVGSLFRDGFSGFRDSPDSRAWDGIDKTFNKRGPEIRLRSQAMGSQALKPYAGCCENTRKAFVERSLVKNQ